MDTPEDLFVENFEENDVEILEDDVNGENVDEQPPAEGDETDQKPVKPKRVVRNPQVLLTAEKLKGSRGLRCLESYFDRVKYKGPGYEEQDLSVILKTYEYWCHRMFPKYPFEECIAKIEKLGTKKPVITEVKKIRANLFFDGDPIMQENEAVTDEVPNDQFDDLLNVSPTQPHIDDWLSGPTSQESSDDLLNAPNTQIEITEEQMERIRLNKEQALKRLQEKLRQRRELAESTTQGGSPFFGLNEPSTSYIEGSSQMASTSSQMLPNEGTSQDETSVLEIGTDNGSSSQNEAEKGDNLLSEVTRMQSNSLIDSDDDF